MNVRPIPDILLGDNITLLVPSSGRWDKLFISNVRVERSESVSDYSSQKARENTGLTVWFDHANSSPKTEFSIGMKVVYDNETYEITEVKNYFTDTPHHCKLKARKIGGEYMK